MATIRERKAAGWRWGITLCALAVAGGAAAQETPTRPREVLKSAIDLYKRGDYEAATPLFAQAQTRQADLSTTEKQDLASYATQNRKALQGRQDGSGIVARAGEALRDGKLSEASSLLKTASANQYLNAADRQQLAELNQQMSIASAGAGQAAKANTRALILSARGLLQKGDLEGADQLASQAEQAGSSIPAWLKPWEDSPAKVHRDVQAARQKLAAVKSAEAGPGQPSSTWTFPSMKGFFTRGGDKQKETVVELPPPPTPVRDAAFEVGKPGETTPRELGVEPVRPETQKRPMLASTASPGIKQDARALVREAAALVQQDRLDEADKLLSQATAIPGTAWGLFEESPETVRRALARARSKRDRDESIKLLADARKLFSEGKLEDAKRAAWHAQKLHGPYSAFDFGDRPQRLLDEIARAELKKQNRIPEKDDAQAARNEAATKPAAPKGRAGETRPISLVSATGQSEAKNRSAALVREARALEQQGKLLEALDKINEARKLPVSFAPEEDSPGAVQLALTGKCNRQIQTLLQQSSDKLVNSGADPARLHAAQLDLEAARRLAQGFGLDTQQIDQRVLSLQQLAAANGAALPLPQTLMTPPSAVHQTAAIDPQQQRRQQVGAEKLDKARLEIRAGNTALARKLAEEMLDPGFGVQADAEALLRSIQAEEHNQRLLAARRAFDAGADAFRTGNYAQARTIFETLDAQLLTPDIQARLRDIMAAREMAAPVRQATHQETTPGKDAAPGKATVRDTAGDALDSVRAMEEVQFQQLRERGLQSQRKAMDLFKAGQSTQAGEILNEYLKQLEGVQLDPERLALLKRPVENRLQQYKTVQAQNVLDKAARDMQSPGHNETKQQLAKQKEQNEVAELVKQYNQLMKEGKEKDAWVLATKASELDPDNPTLKAAIEIAKVKYRQKEWDKNRDSNEQMFIAELNNDMLGKFPTPDNPFAMTEGARERLAKRSSDAKGIGTQRRTPMERAIENKLNESLDLTWKDKSLIEIVEDLRAITGLNIVPDTLALHQAGVSLDQQLSLSVHQIPLRSALNHLLRKAKLTHVIRQDALVITTEDESKGKTRVVVYPVADLVVPVENHTPADVWSLEKVLTKISNSNGVVNMGASPVTGPMSLSQGTPVSSYSSGLGAASSASAPSTQTNTGTRNPTGHTIEDQLMTLIKNTVARDTWDDFGGQGKIQYFPLGMALVINQTQEAQEEIADLLAALRRLQDLQVSIEMRLVSVSEAFFEFMGVNFDVNLRTPTARREFDLVSSNFVQQPFVNRNLDNLNMVTGLTPAMTLTPDLNIPIQNTSFGFAQPPFGNFPGTIGADGGLSLGLAFLSEIQVFMFMEAAQGDRRTQIMQAPKITVFNGQTASVFVSQTQFFVLGVSLNSVNGQLVFTPQNTPVPGQQTGMIVTPVVSADRRFVRLNLIPIVNVPATASTPLIPLQFAVPTIVDGPGIGGTVVGQPTIFQLFIQQPVFDTISLTTTVNVPDGGTVLLGGLKTLSEGRNEYGPPIISKIPYLSRLFKNVGYGREAQSLMIMVTPRIIINEEEEQIFMGERPPIPRP